MTAFASLSLLNYAAVAQTFVPSVIDASGVAKWITNTESTFDARRVATLSVSTPKNGSKVARAKLRVSLPVMDAVDTTLKVADCYCNVEFVLPKQASLTQRRDLQAAIADFLTDATVVAAVENFESIY